jgi:hypothetical protein
VRSKEVPKKPKDLLLTLLCMPRGVKFRDNGCFSKSLPRNRRDTSMSSQMTTSMPSYMMATSCSGAKARQSQLVEAHSSSIGIIIEVADADTCAENEEGCYCHLSWRPAWFGPSVIDNKG